MIDPYQIVKRPLHTEKSVADRDQRHTYHFEVAPDASKEDIKKAIEKIFEVRVADVRTMSRHGKPRRSRMKLVHTSGWKKALVTLAEGDNIDLGY
ncbi:MAG: 50S ribosomal protein L23 [Planctomycetes bacterium]|nr:50S ribosomal protein L23 [Planctomycetota bacterium]